MTKQQAINILNGLEQSLDDYCELNNEGKAAFRMAIAALEVFGNSEQLPSAQPERKTGRWIFEERKRLVDETDDGAVYRIEKWWSCSECGYAKGYQTSRPSSNYCEDCGAKMLKDGEG